MKLRLYLCVVVDLIKHYWFYTENFESCDLRVTSFDIPMTLQL